MEIHTLKQKTTRDGPSSQIKIWATGNPSVDLILFEPTACVNFIGWNKAYAVFPKFDFLDHADWDLNRLRQSAGKHMEDYFYSGDQFDPTQDKFRPSSSNNPVYMRITRYIGDRYTWIIPFDTSKLTGPKTFVSQEEHTRFDICQAYEQNDSVSDLHSDHKEDTLLAYWVMVVCNCRNGGQIRVPGPMGSKFFNPAIEWDDMEWATYL